MGANNPLGRASIKKAILEYIDEGRAFIDSPLKTLYLVIPPPIHSDLQLINAFIEWRVLDYSIIRMIIMPEWDQICFSAKQRVASVSAPVWQQPQLILSQILLTVAGLFLT